MAYDIQDFQDDVIEASRETPVLVDFWAEWCGPCRILGPVLEKLAREEEGESGGGRWRLAKVDTEAFPQEAARYGVRGIPNVKLFVDGEPVDEFVGALPESQLRQWLDQAIPSEEGKALRAAIEEARSVVFDDPARAISLLDGIDPPVELMESVADTEFLARLILKGHAPGDLVDTPAGRSYLEGIQRLEMKDFDGALKHFIQALRADRTLDDEGPRKACAVIFRHLGPEDPVVRERRSELASALYV